MTRTIVAILALSTGMLYAQTTTPAQPGSTPVLQASNTQPVLSAAVASMDKRVVSARAVTVVVPPKCLHAGEVNMTRAALMRNVGDRPVVVQFMIDEHGMPTDLKVVRSANLFIDETVLEAVRDYRYTPATRNGTPVAFPLTMNYTIRTEEAK